MQLQVLKYLLFYLSFVVVFLLFVCCLIIVSCIFKQVAKNNESYGPHTLLDFGSGVGTVEWYVIS